MHTHTNTLTPVFHLENCSRQWRRAEAKGHTALLHYRGSPCNADNEICPCKSAEILKHINGRCLIYKCNSSTHYENVVSKADCTNCCYIQLQQSQESSDEEPDVAKARGVQYKVKGGIPGLENWRGCALNSVSWTPVTPVTYATAAVHAPIAQRTRAICKAWNYLCVSRLSV